MIPRIAKCGLAVLAAAGATSAAYQVRGERADRRRFRPPGRLVDVAGRTLHIWAQGPSNQPTVVIVTGMSSNCLQWVPVQQALLPDHRVFMYDRAGIGWSQAARWWERRNSSVLADELHEVLEASGEPGPYVLVGHSLGGEIVRLYAARHRENVAGLVLVDASSERWSWLVEEFGWWAYGPLRHWRRALTHDLLKPRGIVRAGVRMRTTMGREEHLHRWARQEVPPEWVEASVSLDLTTGHRRAAVMEMIDRGGQKGLLAERRHFGDLPLTVISKAPYPEPDPYAYNLGGERTDDEHRRYADVTGRIQADLAILSNNATHIIAERAGHNIHIDEPDLIVKSIATMCEKVRTALHPSRVRTWTQHHPTQTVTTPHRDDVQIDIEMVSFIKQLWRLGYETDICCQDGGEATLGGGTMTPEDRRDELAARNMGKAWVRLPAEQAERLMKTMQPFDAEGTWVSRKSSNRAEWFSITSPEHKFPR